MSQSSRGGRLIDRGIERGRAMLEAAADRRHRRLSLGDGPVASAEEYRRLWASARERSYPAIDRYEQDCAAAIDPEWFHALALLTQVVSKRSEICYQHGRVLYATLARYTRDRVHDHLTIVETGTARGFSTLCMAKALSDAGASGTIVTFDVLPHEVSMYWNCLRDNDGPCTRAELLRDYVDLIERYVIFQSGDTRRELARMCVPRVHLAFLDSVHTYDHVMAEFASIKGRQRRGDIMVFDDYTPDAYPGVVKAADEICQVHGYASQPLSAGARRYLIAEKA